MNGMVFNDRLDKKLQEAGVGPFRRKRLIATFWIFTLLTPLILAFAVYNILTDNLFFLPQNLILVVALVAFLVLLWFGKPKIAFYLGVLPCILASVISLGLWMWLYPNSGRDFELFMPLILVIVIQIPALIGSDLKQLLVTMAISLVALILFIIELDQQSRANIPLITGMLSAFVLSLALTMESYRSAKTAEMEAIKRDLLQREVHHRIKNETSMLIYFLEQDKASLQSTEALELVQKTRARVLSIFGTHNQLYQSSESTAVSLKVYLASVMECFDLHVGDQNRSVQLEIEGPTLNVIPEDASYIGLICNELVMNTLKHSKTPAKGLIQLQYSLEKDGLKISYHDRGFQKKLEGPGANGFGTRFIEGIMKFKKGSYISHLDRDFSAILVFPKMVFVPNEALGKTPES